MRCLGGWLPSQLDPGLAALEIRVKSQFPSSSEHICVFLWFSCFLGNLIIRYGPFQEGNNLENTGEFIFLFDVLKRLFSVTGTVRRLPPFQSEASSHPSR